MSSTTIPPINVNGKETNFYLLKNSHNLQAVITNYGARLVSFKVPDQNNMLTEINIGFDSVADYLKSTAPYYGATIGRFANRIARGKFSLHGKEYTLAINNGLNSLHSGEGFHNMVWDARVINGQSIELSYLSVDGEEGFPGNLTVKLIYTLTDDNELRIGYEATADQATVVNLTNHAYFNLNGVGSGEITGHLVQINADHYLPVDDTQIPTGEFAEVTSTPFDFKEPHLISERIEADDQQIKYGNGYDLNYVLNRTEGDALSFAAAVTGNKTGIVMEVYTTEPGMQFYTGNFMFGDNVISGGFTDDFRSAFALETQHFPDSPNQPQFPSTVLEPGQVYRTITVYKLSVK